MQYIVLYNILAIKNFLFSQSTHLYSRCLPPTDVKNYVLLAPTNKAVTKLLSENIDTETLRTIMQYHVITVQGNVKPFLFKRSSSNWFQMTVYAYRSRHKQILPFKSVYT